MNMRDLPIIPTVLVVAAVSTMIGLGIWQLGRADEKEALIARYQAALTNAEPVEFPFGAIANEAEDRYFRQSSLTCQQVTGTTSIAGSSTSGQSGLVHIATCQTGAGPAEVKLGFSRDPDTPDWSGGEVSGLIAPGGQFGVRLQPDQPIEGLEPIAKPDPTDLPNNHLAYAGQWFFFALTALVIYILALRRRGRQVA